MNQEDLMKEYAKLIENYLIIISQISYDVTSWHLEDLEESILDYLSTHYQSISISKKEIHELLNRLYQNRHFNLKKTVECSLGKTKYEFESNNKDVIDLIKEEIIKLRTLFSSVSKGTNIHYLDLVKECAQEIMAILIRKNTTLSFAKNTEKVRNDLTILIDNNYKNMMNDLGNNLLLQIVDPLEEKYNVDVKTHVKN